MTNYTHRLRNNLRTWIEIDSSAFIHNFKEIRKRVGPRVKILAVVKSNAYGHGLVPTARTFRDAGADWLGVDSLDEAWSLKQAKLHLPILILGYIPPARLGEVVHGGFRQGIYRQDMLKILSRIAKGTGRNAKLHLKIETGTARQGMYEKDISRCIQEISALGGLVLEGMYSHFANSEDTKSRYWETQMKTFLRGVSHADRLGYSNIIKHIASSAGTFLYPETHLDMVRPGISLYGIWPSREVGRSLMRRKIYLIPALSWKTRIAQIKNLPKGSSVGYGCSERVRRLTRLAVLPVGYWDGFDRKLSRVGEVLVRGKRSRILGSVCMNMVMIDVTDVPRVRVDDTAVILGKSGSEEISAEDISQKIGTINYEIIARINPSISRIFL